MTENNQELYKERMERIDRATSLKEPDRVPILGNYGYFTAGYCGLNHHEFLFDYEKAAEAIIKTSRDFGYDTAGGFSRLGALPLTVAFLGEHDDLMPGYISGPIHDVLGAKYARFPGRELSLNSPFQFIGQEFMKVEEYDDLIDDPKKWIAEKLLPRSIRNLGQPGSAKAWYTLYKWGFQTRIELDVLRKLANDLRRLGFPQFSGGFSYAPLDFIGDFLRDIKNVILDIYRVPDKVLQASEAIKELIFEMAKIQAELTHPGTRIFIPLHLNEYLSHRQYAEFYWPTLKDVINELIRLEMVPSIFYEGRHEAHLETILELPRGKTISRFEKTDLLKAKNIIGGHSLIVGGPPSSLFLGPTEKVHEYVKALLEDMKPNGGYILSPSVTIPATAKAENVEALFNAVEKYGKY